MGINDQPSARKPPCRQLLHCYNARMRFRWLAFVVVLASLACGRQAFDVLGGGPTSTPTGSGSPTPSGTQSATPAPPAAVAGDLVITELFVRDRGGTRGDANLSGDSSSGDDRFVEFVNVADHAVSLDGVQLRIDTDANGGYDSFKTFAAGTVLPTHDAITVFNPSSVSLAPPQAKAGTAAQLMFADTTGHTLDTPLDETDNAMQVELVSGTTVLFWLRMGRDAGTVMHVFAGTNPSNPDYDEVLDVTPDYCGFLGLGTCDGVYSIALADPAQFDGGSHYIDHRRIGTSGNSCNGTTADSCCRMSPGRWTAPTGGSFFCREYGF